jgi:hypothetical protein
MCDFGKAEEGTAHASQPDKRAFGSTKTEAKL